MIESITLYTLDDFYIAEHFSNPKKNTQPNLPAVSIQDELCYPMNGYTKATVKEIPFRKKYRSDEAMLEFLAKEHPFKIEHSKLHLLRVIYSALEEKQIEKTPLVPRRIILSREEFLKLGCPSELELKTIIKKSTI